MTLCEKAELEGPEASTWRSVEKGQAVRGWSEDSTTDARGQAKQSALGAEEA